MLNGSAASATTATSVTVGGCQGSRRAESLIVMGAGYTRTAAHRRGYA